jgi:hypothetical protein
MAASITVFAIFPKHAGLGFRSEVRGEWRSRIQGSSQCSPAQNQTARRNAGTLAWGIVRIGPLADYFALSWQATYRIYFVRIKSIS